MTLLAGWQNDLPALWHIHDALVLGAERHQFGHPGPSVITPLCYSAQELTPCKVETP